MTIPEYIHDRDNALFAAFQDAMSREDVHNYQEAVVAAVMSPTPRFYISAWAAYREILNYKAGRRTKYNPRDLRKELVAELMKRYNRMRRMPSYRGCSDFFISQFVVCQPAPRFYISVDRAEAIISRIRRERYKKRHEKE